MSVPFEKKAISILVGNLNSGLDYRNVASSNTSRLEAHAGFLRLLMKGIFDPFVSEEK